MEQTIIHRDGYPLYKRVRSASYAVREYEVTNANVVPYNNYLLKKYNCHINVEVCTSVKYIFKNIYKGYDCSDVCVVDNNEIEQYINFRYISAPEAVWTFHEFKIHNKSHSIVRLSVHLTRGQMIVFEEGREQDAITNSDVQCTQLLAWFKINEDDLETKHYFYNGIPLHYVFSKENGRKSGDNQQR
ncbi:hypothetical protein NGRA_0473 [Nosema granulosis]|uniref:Uncharacterized protein n=1 Tax=Nosema granulosis TaxID=83296 RepID=A0A9P6L0I2_9MICR|nr:hypothetical protein NGRA_0473 [Nosema granulosis]